MTALLEFKQKIKGLFAQYEVYMMPLLKFILALVYFIWINSNMGYMKALDNIFVVLILALDLQCPSDRNDCFCRMCDDGGTLLCTWNRSGRFSAGASSFHADPVSEIQRRQKHCNGVYATGICI